MNAVKHIGIVAVSAEGAALCYRTIAVEGAKFLGRHAHPEVTLHTYPLSDYMRNVDAGRWEEAGDLLLSSAKKLASVGAEILICPDNTLHQALDLVRRDSPIPWLHIAEEVAAVAADRGFNHVGILGTRYLMEGPVYPSKLSAKGIKSQIPELADRRRINDIIFDELVYGRFEETSLRCFQQVIRRFAQHGCAAVVLGCTEIPLLISDSDSPLPTLDSTRILAQAALREATRGARGVQSVERER
jgi:aspartate racemase